MKKINLMSKRIAAAAGNRPPESDAEITNMMLDARYLRQSSSLIQEALQKGFDVLQLANGDIVTTGTKTVVYQYVWDDAKGKLIKAKPDRKSRKSDEMVDEDHESEEA
jgi:hypothetical protein